MLPEIIELKILEYLSIKPQKRCRATNNKGNICKKNAIKGYLICQHHKKILEKKTKKYHIQFAELCIMLRRVIKNNKYKYFGTDNYNSWLKVWCQKEK
jgi:hypothetical protein